MMSLAINHGPESAINTAADKVSGAIGTASSKASEIAEAFQERASQAAAVIGDQANKVAGSVAGATTAVRNAAADAGKRADQFVGDAGAGIQTVADRIGAIAPDHPRVSTAVNAVADSVRQTGKYLEESKLSGAADDLVGLVRRYPIPAVLLAAGLGWYVARSGRRG